MIKVNIIVRNTTIFTLSEYLATMDKSHALVAEIMNRIKCGLTHMFFLKPLYSRNIYSGLVKSDSGSQQLPH